MLNLLAPPWAQEDLEVHRVQEIHLFQADLKSLGSQDPPFHLSALGKQRCHLGHLLAQDVQVGPQVQKAPKQRTGNYFSN